MKKLLTVLVIFTFELSFSQNFLFLNSGEKIEYKSLEISDNTLSIKTPDKKMLSYPVQDIWGTCGRRMLLATSSEVSFFSNPKLIAYDIEGEINVASYSTSTSAGPYGGGTTTTYYFAIKKGVIHSLENTTLIKGKQKRQAVIRELLGDKAAFQIALKDSTKNFGSNEMLEMIKLNNLNEFKPPVYMNPTTVFFYSSTVQSKGTLIEVIVNDKSLGNIPKTGVMPIQLDSKELSKVCLKSGDLSTCELMRGGNCGIAYCTINVKREIEIRRASSKDWEYFQKSRFAN